MIQLYHGNALDVMQRDLGLFDAIITDPPYASGATLSSKQSSTSTKYTATKGSCPFPDFCGDAVGDKITKPGGRILDPFADGGSTLAAAQLEGFNAVGIEVHAEICKAAAERLGITVESN